MRFIIIFILLITNSSLNSNNLIDKGNLGFFKNKHFNIINSNCSNEINKKECFVKDIKNFYSGLNLLDYPYGEKYYLKCYEDNKIDIKTDYYNLSVCTQYYKNILSYDFLDKVYNYIFLEEDKLIQSLTVKCTMNQTNEGNVDLMNRCISKERKSFKFFKANYFSSSNQSAEKVFSYCLNKFQEGIYSFKFSNINSCIKKNTYDF
jgi:hypothetical protein